MCCHLLSDGPVRGVTFLVGDDRHVDLHESVRPDSPGGESPPAGDGGLLAGVCLTHISRETDGTHTAAQLHWTTQLQYREVKGWEVV